MLAPFRSRGLTPYVIGIIGVALAWLIRKPLDPFLGEHLSFSFDYLAVFIAAWTGGFWPAMVTAVFSALVGNYFFTLPRQSLAIRSVEELIDLIFFMMVSATIGFLSEVSLRALARAKKAEQEKDNFMATVAHELRSPLSAIYYANSLNRMASEQPTDQLDVIDRQVSYLNLLIEDLLDVSRVARDKIRLKKERIDAATIIDRAIERVRPLLAERKHELELDISSQAMPLNVDPVRVEQVLTNLLTNAAKYTPEGGKVWVTADRDDSSVHFRVRDNGIGISRDILPQIFDLFVQGDRARDQDEGGLGIGLALVRKICEMHGGSVRASSAGKNCGSEFLITLPLEKPAPLPLQVAL